MAKGSEQGKEVRGRRRKESYLRKRMEFGLQQGAKNNSGRQMKSGLQRGKIWGKKKKAASCLFGKKCSRRQGARRREESPEERGK